jgi:hypothetical protein
MKDKIESRDLTRLVLLKELFNVFVNRLVRSFYLYYLMYLYVDQSSFDTKTSIVLGLVTCTLPLFSSVSRSLMHSQSLIGPPSNKI